MLWVAGKEDASLGRYNSGIGLRVHAGEMRVSVIEVGMGQRCRMESGGCGVEKTGEMTRSEDLGEGEVGVREMD